MIRKLLDSPWLYFTLAGFVLVAAVLSQFEINLPSRPTGTVEDLKELGDRDDINVVFILIDTLRADRLGSYGYSRDTTPIIDFLSATGIRFAHVQSQSSWTKCSMASLWTGLYPRRVGVLRYPDALPEGVTTAPEVFKNAGYLVGGVFRNGWVESNFGFDQGYDMYLKPLASQTLDRFQHANPSIGKPIVGSDLDVTDSASEFIRSNADQRFFLYLHYMDLHQYLYETDTADASFGTGLSDAYDNALRWTDRNVSAVVGVIEQEDLLDNTLIVIASDHGEAFYEHGAEGHARNLYREVTETPFIIILPFRLPETIVVEEPVQNIDLWPTILDLVGLDPLPQADGRSLVPLIESAGGQSSDVDGLRSRTAFAELDQRWGRKEISLPIVAMVEGDHRFVYHLEAPEKPELYNRVADPKEQRNIAGDHPELVARLTERTRQYLAETETGRTWEVPQVELDEMRMSQLRALGYVDLDK